jgi:hypothetical protein
VNILFIINQKASLSFSIVIMVETGEISAIITKSAVRTYRF